MDNKGNPPAYSEPSPQWMQGQMTSPVQNQYGYPAQTNPGYPNPPAPYPTVMQHTSSEIIVTAAPNVYQVGAPPDYTTQAWMACLCCFWPTGLLAIARATESRDALARGDLAAAHQAANHARQMIRISYLVGFISIVIIMIIVIVQVSAISSSYDY